MTVSGRKVTQEEFVEKLKKKNPNLIVIGQYINMKNSIRVKCLKCAYEMDINAGNLLSKYQTKLCPNCSNGRRKIKTKEERESGPTNFIMGLAFISEGAIPYAAADPLHVLPSCIAGSAIAGGISMFFGCTLMAPHGGIFVFPVVGNALMYLVALVVGTAVSAVLLGLLKKKVA